MLEVVELLLLLLVVVGVVVVGVGGQLFRQIQGLVVGSFFKSTGHTHGELWQKNTTWSVRQKISEPGPEALEEIRRLSVRKPVEGEESQNPFGRRI